MTINEGESPAKRAKTPKPPPSDLDIERPPTRLSPTQRLDAMTRDRIDTLETDKSTLDQRLESCRDELRRIERDNATLREKNAVLRERLDDQGSWDVLATLLVGFGGLLSGAAAYLPKIGMAAGLIGFGLFAAGLIMQTNRLYRRFRVSQA